MWRFLLFIIFIILIQRLSKSLQEQQKEQQKEEAEDRIENLFQTLGFPLPEKVPPQPKPEKPKEPPVKKKDTKRPEVITTQFKPPEIKPQSNQLEETQEELVTFSTDKLTEGVILAVILGSPKAYQIRRGGGIGIHAGLKNP